MDLVVVSLAIAGVLLFLIVLVAFSCVFSLYSGYGTRVEFGVGNPPIGQVVIAYKFGRGSYSKSSSLLVDVREDVPGFRCLGLYYDAPNWTHFKEVPYAVGVILAEGTEEVDQRVARMLAAAGFRFFQLPQVENVVHSTFPNVSFVSGCLASKDVYSRMREYVKKHRLCAHPYVEVYQDKTIHYMVPLSRQGDFYVPEALPYLEEQESYESLQHMEDGESHESFDGDDYTQALSESDILASSDDDTQTEDSDLESSVLSQEPENSPQEVGAQEPENSPQEVGALPQAVPGQEREIEPEEDSMSSFEELEFEPENAGDDDDVQ